MATTTTNFGWDIPQSTDLVKDGATAIAALGQDIDTALVDLKGGTTGQVLSKASGTDLDFTWVAQDDSNAIQNAIVDAKGDLIAATAADTPARLAVGTNGQVLTADSTAATGIKWATPASATTFAGCRVYMSAAQSIANNTDVTLNFNTEAFDTDAYHDTVTNNSRITIPTGKAGKYLFNGQINFASNTAGQRWISIKDGTGTIVARSNMMTVNGDTTFINCSGVVNCAVGDYFILQAYQTSGSSINANGNSESTWFSTTYLGA